MKQSCLTLTTVFISGLLSANFAFAAEKSAAKVSSSSTKASTQTHLLDFTGPTSRTALISTSLSDITQNRPNIDLSFFVTSNLALTLRYRSQSDYEQVLVKSVSPKQEAKTTVDRTRYILGATGFLYSPESSRNVLFSTGVISGQTKSVFGVESQTGVAFRLAGLMLLTKNVTADLGMRLDIIEDSTRGALEANVGYLF